MGCSADARVYQSLELQSGIKIICHIVKYRLDGSSCDYMTEWNINLNESSVSLPQTLIWLESNSVHVLWTVKQSSKAGV